MSVEDWEQRSTYSVHGQGGIFPSGESWPLPTGFALPPMLAAALDRPAGIASPECLITTAADGRIVEFPAAAQLLFGYGHADAIGRPVGDLFEPAAPPFTAEAPASRQETTARRIDGRPFAAEVVTTPLTVNNHRRFTLLVRDLSERRDYERRLHRLAYFDQQTGLPNRTILLHSLGRALADGQSPCLLVIDIDRFRMLKNSLGFDLGNRLLVEFVRRLSTLLQPGEMLARLFSDDFGWLINRPAPERPDDSPAAAPHRRDALNARVAMIEAALRRPFQVENREVRLSASIGIVEAAPGDDAEAVMRHAEIAAYQVRRAGGSGHGWFDDAMRARLVEAHDTETELRGALEHPDSDFGRLWNAYQPIIDLTSGALVGFEALMRWTHPRRGTIPPLVAIPVAEETGLIDQLGADVLARACRRLAQWTGRHAAAAGLFISVNLSPRQLADPALPDRIGGILADTGIDPGRLKLEITESAVKGNVDAAVAVLHRLKDRGIRLSIDDFGTGYSAFSHLHRLPVDSLKIDRSFVNAMTGRPRNRNIVRVIAELARSLDLEVIVEGIETPAELAVVRELGCDFGQGYLVAMPLPAAEVETLLAGPLPWADRFLPGTGG